MIETKFFLDKATKSPRSIFGKWGDCGWNEGRSTVDCWFSAPLLLAQFFVEGAFFAEIFHRDAVATEPSRVRIYLALGACTMDLPMASAVLASLSRPEPHGAPDER